MKNINVSKILILLLLILVTTDIVFRVIFRSPTGFVFKLVQQIDLSLHYRYRVSLLKKDAQWRELHPPSSEELALMQTNARWCYVDDDCNNSQSELFDCNWPRYNKYYIMHPGKIYNPAMWCPTIHHYGVCINNQCERRTIKTFFPRY